MKKREFIYIAVLTLLIGALVAAVGFLAFYVGLLPFDRQPSIEKVRVLNQSLIVIVSKIAMSALCLIAFRV